jgi:SAM-dependent methyltransferase
MSSSKTHGERTGSHIHFDRVAHVYRHLPRGIPVDYGALLIDRLGVGEGTRLAELGCGVGEVAIWIARSGVQVTGVDSSIEMLRYAQRSPGAGGVRWVNRSVQDFDFGRDHFDAVFSFESFHLFPDPTLLVARIGEALVPGGRFGIGWRIASWEAQFKDSIVSIFSDYGISMLDWDYSTCYHFERWVAAARLFGAVERVEVIAESQDTIDDAATFLASIERTSSLHDDARDELRQRLAREFSLRSGDRKLIGSTIFGLKYVRRLSRPGEWCAT